MKVIGLNGSPRKGWNTATLLERALEGAASHGAQTELLHLYDLNYKGCISCFACKLKGGRSYGRCALQDELTPVLEQIAQADAVILGSPIYWGEVTGEMRSFLERLLFPYTAYSPSVKTLFPRRIRIGVIYTGNIPEEAGAYYSYLHNTEQALSRLLGDTESMFCYDTYQFEDYAKYASDMFDPEKKAARRREVFPLDCKKAFEMGERLVTESGQG